MRSLCIRESTQTYKHTKKHANTVSHHGVNAQTQIRTQSNTHTDTSYKKESSRTSSRAWAVQNMQSHATEKTRHISWTNTRRREQHIYNYYCTNLSWCVSFYSSQRKRRAPRTVADCKRDITTAAERSRASGNVHAAAGARRGRTGGHHDVPRDACTQAAR